MLTAIRRLQKSILIVVTAIIIVAFAWLYDSSSYDKMGATEIFNIDGRSYRRSEYQKLARTYDLCRRLGTFEFLIAMTGRQNQDTTRYVVNLLVLRNQAGKLGIRPSEEQIRNFIVALPIFQKNESYDPQMFEEFKTNLLSPNGLTDADLYQFISDAIAFAEIRDLLAAGTIPAPSVVQEAFEDDYTQVTAARVNLPRDNGTPPAEITDEAISKFYNENTARLLSQTKRQIEYVLFAKPEPAEDLPDEAKKVQLQVYGKQVAEFSREVLREGANFSAVAKKFGTELKTSEAFSYSDPPADLKNSPQLLSAVFGQSLSIPISDPVNTSKGYALFNLLKIVEPKPLTLAEATPQIREQLESNAAATAVQAGAAASRAKLAAELTSGKPFKKAVTDAGFTAIDLPAFSPALPPSAQADASTIVMACIGLEKGHLSNVLNGADGAFLVYVKNKELSADDTANAQRQRLSDSINRMIATVRFEAWLSQAAEASGVKFPEVAVQ